MTPPGRTAVIGAGVIGLSAACELLARSHDVTVIAAAFPPETTSDRAGAVWYPYRAAPRERVLVWAARTLERFGSLINGGTPGLRWITMTELHRDPVPVPWWMEIVPGYRELGSTALPQPFTQGFEFDTVMIDVPIYLEFLVAKIVAGGARLDGRRLGTLDEVSASGEFSAIVNCSGLGAGRLVGDPDVYPIRGQIARVQAPGIRAAWVEDRGGIDGLTYALPRGDSVVVGGTEEEGEWGEDPDPATIERILARASGIDPALLRAPRLSTSAGLRPGRATVRLETERRGKDAPIVVHAYGHGGSGFTLSWGCAEEVASRL